MFTRFKSIIFNSPKGLSKRNYWIAPVEPTHDIVEAIGECQKWQLTYFVKKSYTNHLIGSSISMEPKQLLNCERFKQVKKQLEANKFVFSINKDKTLGPNMFGIKFDEFNKHVTIVV